MAAHDSPSSTPAPPVDDSLPQVSADEVEQALGEELDSLPPMRDSARLGVVALGGSAGGITAMGRFFESTPTQSGMAFVVVLHLAPDHHSILPEMLQRDTTMPVKHAQDGAKLKADHVYVIPPGKHLTTHDGYLRLTELQHERGQRVAVDMFFRSLADSHGPNAVAIVLSGGDGDGAIGIKRIKERGGLTIAQDLSEAEHPSMPESAIETGMVDWVLPVAEMPQRIIGYRARGGRLQLPPERGPELQLTVPEQQEILLREILEFLRARTGRDFTYYKRATVLRRIARRMQVSGVDDFRGYLEVLRTHTGEAAALVAELLISVTNFFRDPECFDRLLPRIAELFSARRSDIRIWVPACATGEEAYSIAMMLLEQAPKLQSPPMMQIFATDLDDQAIRFARAGLYPDTIAADVSEARLERFFTKVSKGYLVRRALRERILFATHDLLKDAPFSRLDVLTCRNLLIYLNREAQARCFEIFNFALKPDGTLFLGASETVPEGSALFTPVDKAHHLYRQRPVQRVGVPMLGSAGDSAVHRAVQRQELLKSSTAALPSAAFGTQQPLQHYQSETVFEELPPVNELHFRLLGRWGPPSALVNADHEIVHLSENASRFLSLPEGKPTRNLLRLAQPGLRASLRSALLAAESEGRPIDVTGHGLQMNNGPEMIDLRVVPAGELAPGHYLVMFNAQSPVGTHVATGTSRPLDLDAEAMMQQMERQLERAGVRLRATVEQYEISSEELKASNEELQAMNEELRGAGEELESGREELQSVNEELTTLNSEFRSRVEELSRINSDLHNLMSATQIATVFIDRQLQIMRYTPSAVPLFNFIASDIGRPISDLRQRLDYSQLTADAEQVLRDLVPVERELRDNGRWLLARALPYRTVEDQIAGVVLTFIDITERKSFEGAARASEHQLQTLADAVPQLIWTNDGDGKAVYFNRRWYEYSGLTTEESVGPGWQAIVHPQDWERSVALWQRALLEGEVFECEYRLKRADGTYRWFIGRNVPTPGPGGKVESWFGTATDVHDMKLAEVSLRASEEQFRRAIEDAPIPVIMQAEDGQVLQLSKAWTALTGFSAEDVPTFDAWLSSTYGPGAETVRSHMHDLFSGGVSVLNAELDVTTRSGSGRHWIFSASAPGTLRDGRRFVVGMVVDITDRRIVEEQLRVSQERLRLIVENARDFAIISLDLDRRVTSWNTGAQTILGYAQEEALGMDGDAIFTPEDRAAGAPQGEASKALAEGRAADERWHVRKDGRRFWGSGVMMAMQDEAGTPQGLVKIFRDQTVELHAKEEMQRVQRELHAALHDTEVARDEAQAAGRAKDHFLAVLSHELRAPLTPVLLGAQILARNKALPPAVLDTIGVIERNARLQAHLVDDLLDVSRIMHGKVELSLEALDLHVVLTRAVEVAHPDVEAKGQHLDVSLEAEEHTIQGDGKRLQQVFWNLLKNASKFTPAGGRIALRSWSEGGRLMVQVRDTGAGFEPEAAERIFGVFEQGSRDVTAQFGGLGLGLSIARASVKAHGGTVTALSDGPGTGATFTVALPLADSAPRQP